MKKAMASRDSSVLFYGGVVGVLCAIWAFGNWVNQKFDALEVMKLKRVQSQQVSTDTKAFYPVWVKQRAAILAERQADGSLDLLFKRPEEAKPVELPVPPTPPEPDYAQLVQQSAFVSAITDNGAVINGRFYAIGDKMDDLAFMPPGKASIAPALAGVKGDAATISIGKKSVVIRMASIN
jgi:hypothetical protein